MVLTLLGKFSLLYHCLTFSSEILFATMWQCHQEGMQESSVYSWKPCFSGEESQLRELGLFRPCDCSLCEGWGKEGSGVGNPEQWSCCCAEPRATLPCSVRAHVWGCSTNLGLCRSCRRFLLPHVNSEADALHCAFLLVSLTLCHAGLISPCWISAFAQLLIALNHFLYSRV